MMFIRWLCPELYTHLKKDRGYRILAGHGPAIEGTPIEECYNTDKEKKRQAVNDWIRSSGAFDGVIDFDAVARDPNRPATFWLRAIAVITSIRRMMDIRQWRTPSILRC